MSGRGRTLRGLAGAALCLAALVLAGPAWAKDAKTPAKAADPDALSSELDQLRIMYKDDHPDVIRAKRALERARERVRERQAEKARQAGQGSGGQEAPESPQVR